MFVRQKKNRSGSTSVVVVDKSNGRFREVKIIGTSSDQKTITELCKAGRKWIEADKGEVDMFAVHEEKSRKRG